MAGTQPAVAPFLARYVLRLPVPALANRPAARSDRRGFARSPILHLSALATAVAVALPPTAAPAVKSSLSIARAAGAGGMAADYVPNREQRTCALDLDALRVPRDATARFERMCKEFAFEAVEICADGSIEACQARPGFLLSCAVWD